MEEKFANMYFVVTLQFEKGFSLCSNTFKTMFRPKSQTQKFASLKQKY